MKCKLTQTGMEYRGSIAKTISDIRCQAWYTEEPMHEVSKDISDNDFPERSMKSARNYCRNPTGDVRGPWCYTVDPSLIDDKCDVPLCNFRECKLSGPGAEYSGSRRFSTSGKKCKLWHKRYKLEDTKNPKFDENNFPEQSRKKADNFCRNPTGDIGGPWCYVEQEHFEYVQKEYCDVPFCDDRDCLIFAKNVSSYSVITKLNGRDGNISFWIKLWNPNDEKKGEARILLSLLPVPASAEKIAEEWSAGVELMFSNFGSGQTFPTHDEDDNFEKTPEILLGTKWTGIWVTWAGGFISAGIDGTSKPLVMQEYKKKYGITKMYPETFLHYGLRGTDVLWGTAFCQTYCEVHTTLGIDFSRVWSMEKNNDTMDVRFYVRASQNVHIRLYQSPAIEYPSVTVTIGKHITTLTYQESNDSAKHYLREIPSKGSLNFWSWNEYSISIFGEHLRLFSQKIRGAIEMFYANEKLFATLRWFSIGSENSIAHWTLFCPPGEADVVEEPSLPNCNYDTMSYDYKGTQWTTINEIPCIPWISKEVPEEEKIDNKFVDRSTLKALNKCRNPTHDSNGPYCYAFTPWESVTTSKQYCPIRNCKSSECRTAGTANDYVGTLSETRAGYKCINWQTEYDASLVTKSTIFSTSKRTPRPTRVRPFQQKRPYDPQELLFAIRTTPTIPPTVTPASVVKFTAKHSQKYFNDSLYPDGSAKNASNYCRNPSRNIAGTWCYTTDISIPQDLCNVRDCEKSALSKPGLASYLGSSHSRPRRQG
ncbi:plasminogen isoform X2 [Andrena cerasifolii]|uniref:plasminogen isoform X2 n=1 Tax=Andrena cerasifolii TaxID=2819439 RepID=UPI0040380688